MHLRPGSYLFYYLTYIVLPCFLWIPEAAPETDAVDTDIMAELEKVMGPDVEVWFWYFCVYCMYCITSNDIISTTMATSSQSGLEESRKAQCDPQHWPGASTSSAELWKRWGHVELHIWPRKQNRKALVFLLGQVNCVLLNLEYPLVVVHQKLPKQDPVKTSEATPPIDLQNAMSVLNRLDTTQLEAL